MATLSYQQADVLGAEFAMEAADVLGDQVTPSTHGAVLVTNDDAAPITVTVAVPGTTVYGQPEPDFTVAVPAGESRIIGPFGADLADDDGLVSLSYSAVASVTVAAIQI